MISFFCPFCKHVIKAADESAGTLIACEQCKLDIRVPQPTAAPTLTSSPAPSPSEPSPSWWRRFLHRGGQHADSQR